MSAPAAAAASLAARPVPRRNDGLDVARSLAILLVLVSHFLNPLAEWGPDYAYGLGFTGAAGVNIFFSLSGFLIGRLLLTLADHGLGGAGIPVFWARRWLRTLPLYYVVLTFMVLYFGIPSAGSYLFLQNFTFGQPQPLIVAWSLVLEEFFYLFYPLLMLAAAAVVPGRRAVVAVSLSLIVLCNAARWAVSHWHLPVEWPSMNPFLRLDCCAYGVLAACAVAGGSREAWLRRWAPVILPAAALLILGQGAVTVGLATPGFVEAIRFGAWGELWLTLDCMWVPAVAAVAIPALAAAAPVLPGLAGFAVRQVSLLSYALYLVHTVVVAVLGPILTPWLAKTPATIVVALASVLAAWVLNHAVERPFLRLRDRFVPDVRGAPA